MPSIKQAVVAFARSLARRVPRPANARGRSFVVALSWVGVVLASLPIDGSAVVRIEDYAVSTWAAAPVSAGPATANRVNNQTVRNVIHTTVGGDKVRIKLSNRYGNSTLLINTASVALSTGAESIVQGSNRPLTFNGMASFTIPANGELWSDWIDFRVGDQTDLAVDLYISADTSASSSPLTIHNARPATQNLSWTGSGNLTGVTTLPSPSARTIWFFVVGVDVAAPKAVGAIAAFGDSITDGTASIPYANARWPDYLARRIGAQTAVRPMGVPNLGIGGNRVVGNATGDNALARFDRDVLVQTGVTHIIVLEGVNDLTNNVIAARIIEGLQQLIDRAHAKGLKIFGATLTPYADAPAARETQRLLVNDWIRNSGEYDGVIDFDAVIRDPNNTRRMLPQYDSGDTLHPNSAGYEVMANAIDLNLFKP